MDISRHFTNTSYGEHFYPNDELGRKVEVVEEKRIRQWGDGAKAKLSKGKVVGHSAPCG